MDNFFVFGFNLLMSDSLGNLTGATVLSSSASVFNLEPDPLNRAPHLFSNGQPRKPEK